ncbi:N-acetylglucosamine kinase [Nakamurella endophytica]|uniref:ATPase n=1 Tax=Nakamurella endophytica TaxID=1748367 RepID=A0A917SUV0_9ACTN|nr:BadF/BadG/BcrA/BcrD ATPase family protein [Nakamurella endophytica]GGL97519.1 ATPase [Nakamurella endophytica]
MPASREVDPGADALVVGLDVGGTKTAVRAERADTVVVDTTVPSAEWTAEPVAEAAAWLHRIVQETVTDDGAGGTPAAIAVGAQGCDDEQHCVELGEALARLSGVPTVVTNDAALLLPAAGLARGVGVIAGTGSIAVAVTAGDGLMFAGGWGWVLGDEGSAPALVREGTRAVLRLHDSGGSDPLLTELLQAFHVPDPPRLARAVNDDPSVQNWVRGTVPLFRAAARGSVIARDVIAAGARALAELVLQLHRRGADTGTVVAAGTVMTRQPLLYDGFTAAIGELLPASRTVLLTAAPVTGAMALARRLLSPVFNAEQPERRPA